MHDGDRHIPTGIDPKVWHWLPRRSSRGMSWTLERVMRAKGAKRISVVLPARNEEQTVGRIVALLRRRLVEQHDRRAADVPLADGSVATGVGALELVEVAA